MILLRLHVDGFVFTLEETGCCNVSKHLLCLEYPYTNTHAVKLQKRTHTPHTLKSARENMSKWVNVNEWM